MRPEHMETCCVLVKVLVEATQSGNLGLRATPGPQSQSPRASEIILFSVCRDQKAHVRERPTCLRNSSVLHLALAHSPSFWIIVSIWGILEVKIDADEEYQLS